MTNLQEDTDQRITAIYYCPANDGREVVILLEMNSIKRYRRIWLNLPVGTDDWTWFKPNDAVQLA